MKSLEEVMPSTPPTISEVIFTRSNLLFPFCCITSTNRVVENTCPIFPHRSFPPLILQHLPHSILNKASHAAKRTLHQKILPSAYDSRVLNCIRCGAEHSPQTLPFAPNKEVANLKQRLTPKEWMRKPNLPHTRSAIFVSSCLLNSSSLINHFS